MKFKINKMRAKLEKLTDKSKKLKEQNLKKIKFNRRNDYLFILFHL